MKNRDVEELMAPLCRLGLFAILLFTMAANGFGLILLAILRYR